MVFCTIAFYGVITGGDFLNYVITGYVYKVLVEVVFLPVTYPVIGADQAARAGLRARRRRQVRCRCGCATRVIAAEEVGAEVGERAGPRCSP